MYEHISNLEHTIVNKGSMKVLQRFIQLKMKEHDCYWAWFKGRDNQDELATWHKIFQRSPSPRLQFCKAKSSLDGCDSVLHDDWLDIPWVVIFYSFCFKPGWLVTKIPEGIFSQLCFYAHFTRALQQKVKAHVISRKCLL